MKIRGGSVRLRQGRDKEAKRMIVRDRDKVDSEAESTISIPQFVM